MIYTFVFFGGELVIRNGMSRIRLHLRESIHSWSLPARSGLVMVRSFQRIYALYASQDAEGSTPAMLVHA